MLFSSVLKELRRGRVVEVTAGDDVSWDEIESTELSAATEQLNVTRRTMIVLFCLETEQIILWVHSVAYPGVGIRYQTSPFASFFFFVCLPRGTRGAARC